MTIINKSCYLQTALISTIKVSKRMALFGSNKNDKFKTFEVNNFDLPCLKATPAGIIAEINTQFTKMLHYSRDEIVNQNVHTLIPPKFMKKAQHEKLVGRYTYGKQSSIVGSQRTLPVKDGNDEDAFFDVQIIPFATPKKEKFRFICFFHPLTVSRVFEVDVAQHNFEQVVHGMDEKETFRMDSDDVKNAVGALRVFINFEAGVLINFIQQNKSNRHLSDMVRYFVLTAPLGNLVVTRRIFTKKFAESEVAFLNAVALRIIFPALINNYKNIGPTLEILKERLYEDHLNDSDSGHSGNSGRTGSNGNVNGMYEAAKGKKH